MEKRQMTHPVNKWFNEVMSDRQVVILIALLVSGLGIVYFFGEILTPVLVSVVLAYLLDGMTTWLVFLRIPRLLAVMIVFAVYLLGFVVLTVWLYPLISKQLIQLVSQVPVILAKGREMFMALPETYPDLLTPAQVHEIYGSFSAAMSESTKKILAVSVSSVKNVGNLVVYVILVPLLVFFFLKDKGVILDYISRILPRKRELATLVWDRVNVQVSGYVRGKGLEIVIVWGGSWIAYYFIGLQYSLLLSFLSGISVILPYVGVGIVFIPTLIVPFLQFGWGVEVAYTVAAYTVIQILDANVLVPLLLSEVVDLHPVVIVMAVLFFGGIWGIWGLFFAIPLATLIKVLIDIWLERRGL